MQNSEVPCDRDLIGRIVKTYDYINHVVLTLPLSVYEGTWTYSSFSLLCITMILRVRRNFFEITTFPNSALWVKLAKMLDVPGVAHREWHLQSPGRLRQAW